MTARVKTFKIHISNMPKDLTQAELKIMFEPFGRIVECEVFKKAYAFVHMEEEECGRAAIKELHGKSIEGHVICVTPSNNVEPPNIPTMKLSIKNIEKGVSPHTLRSLFQRFGLVLECEIRPGMGTGTIALEATGDIRSAINEMNGFNLEGKAIEVEAVKVNLKQNPVPGDRPPPNFRPAKPPHKRMSYTRQFNQGPPPEQYFAEDNYFDDEGYGYGGGDESQYWEGPPDMMHNNNMMGQEYYDNANANMNYGDYGHGHEDLGGGYSLNEDYGEDHYDDGNEELPFGYNAPPRSGPMPTNVNARFRQQMAHRYYQPPKQMPQRSYQRPKQEQPPPLQVAPGEAYPPPPLRMPGQEGQGPKKDFVRKERGGRNRMTSGKKAVVQALAASGVNLPRNYVPTMLKRPGAPPIAIMGPRPRMNPPPMFSNGGEDPSPNFLPVAGFRGYRVPMPRLGGPPRMMGRGGPSRMPRFPGLDGGPVFRNPMGPPRIRPRPRAQPGSMLRPTYGPPPQSQPQPLMHQQPLAPPPPPPQSIMDIDFTADVDFY